MRSKAMAGLLTIILALSFAQAAAEPVAWELVNEYPASALPGEADTYFAAAINQRLAGKLTVKPVFDAASGLRSKDQLKAVATGRFAMADTFGGAAGDDHALLLLSSLPFLAPSADHAKILFDLARPAYERVFAAMNQKLLYVSPWPPSGLWATGPIGDIAALKALKVRTYDKTGTDVLTRVGAIASVVSFADLNAKLESGEINAVLSSGDGGAGRQLWKYLKHFADVGYAIPLSFSTVNLDAWKSLDETSRSAIESVAVETTARQWAAMTGRVERNFIRMRENGVTIDDSPPSDVSAALRLAADAALADWLSRAGAEGKKLLDDYNARVRR